MQKRWSRRAVFQAPHSFRCKGRTRTQHEPPEDLISFHSSVQDPSAHLSGACCTSARRLRFWQGRLPLRSRPRRGTSEDRTQSFGDDYDAAYEAYLQATLSKPKDLRYKAHFERMRFQAAVTPRGPGTRIASERRPAGGVQRIPRALRSTPAIRLRSRSSIKSPANSTTRPSGAGSPPGQQSGSTILLTLSGVASPIELKPVSNDPITLHAVEDVKNIYQAIGKWAGLNVIFDPDYQSKRIPVDLTNVYLDDALRIVGHDLRHVLQAGHIEHDLRGAGQSQQADGPRRPGGPDVLPDQRQPAERCQRDSDGDPQRADPSMPRSTLCQARTRLSCAPRRTRSAGPEADQRSGPARPKWWSTSRSSRSIATRCATSASRCRNHYGSTPQANPNANETAAPPARPRHHNVETYLNSLANMNANNFAVTISGGTLNALLSDAIPASCRTHAFARPTVSRRPSRLGRDSRRDRLLFAGQPRRCRPGRADTVPLSRCRREYRDDPDGPPRPRSDAEDEDRSLARRAGHDLWRDGADHRAERRRTDDSAQRRRAQHPRRHDLPSRKRHHSGTPGLARFRSSSILSVRSEVQQDEIIFLLIPHIVRESVLTRRIPARSIPAPVPLSSSVRIRHSPGRMKMCFRAVPGRLVSQLRRPMPLLQPRSRLCSRHSLRRRRLRGTTHRRQRRQLLRPRLQLRQVLQSA